MATDRAPPTDESGGGHQPRIPGVGDDPRDAKDTPDPAGKIWFRDLDEAVIEADRCIQCGSCVAACPSDSIGIDDLDRRPTLVKMCTGCSRCWDACPRSGLRYERLNDAVAGERVRENEDEDEGEGAGDAASSGVGVVAARAADERIRAAGQDGGAVTALLAGLLEAGEIDGAVVARESDDAPLQGEAHLATTPEELLAGAGSFYTQTMQLGRFEELVGEARRDGTLPPDPDVALVGTPCVIEGATALSEFGREGELDELALTIALVCTRSFEYDRLGSILAEHGVDPADVDHLDVADGKLRAYAEGDGAAESASKTNDAEGPAGDGPTDDGDAAAAGDGGDAADDDPRTSDDGDRPADSDAQLVLETDVDAFDAAGLDGCAECADFAGRSADVSAGNVASPDGATTLVVRGERGRAALEAAGDALATEPVEDDEPLRKIAGWNRRKAERTAPRALDEEGALTIGYEEHRAAYDGTDRAPEPHNPARVYQYERWC